MALSDRDRYLKGYEVYSHASTPFAERLFQIIFVLILSGFAGFGLYLKTIKIVPPGISERIEQIKTRFLIEEKKEAAVKEKPRPKPIEKKTVIEEPIDLTKNPVLKEKVDDIQENQPVTVKNTVKRVYGLRRVYSKGIGAGGSLSEAVVGKLGNTLNKEVDTVTATKEEIKGQLVSTTTVTTAPSFKKRVKPEYTAEMLENRIEGVVKVKVLVDIDGKVKKAIPLDDLGYGSKDVAVRSCFDMLFNPAMRGSDPVAVWIIIPIRFVLLG